MNATRLLICLVLACFSLGAHAEEPYTPKAGSNERKEICDGLRAFLVQEYAEKKLPKAIVLKIEHLKVLGDAGLVSRGREAQTRPVHLEAEVFDLMTAWIERYRRQAEERYQRLDAVLAAMAETEEPTEQGAAS